MEDDSLGPTTSLRRFGERYPILAYLLLCFGITWLVWFCVPLVARGDWALGKVVTAAGFGPAMAAIVLDRMRGTGGTIGTGRWWTAFSMAFGLVAALHLSNLALGDGITAHDFSTSQPTGLTPVGVISSLAAAAVAGAIFASLACSHSSRLRSILTWKVPARWWLVALFGPACWMLLGLGITWALGGTIEPVDGGLPPLARTGYLVRSTLFTLLVVATGEEAGWRGWMLPELQKRFSPLLSSVVLGVFWGLWHFPLYLNGQYPGAPTLVFAKAGACVMLAILFTWLYNRTGGNLLLAIVLHTALNNTPRIIPATEGMGIVVLAALGAVIIADRMWRRRAKTPLATSPAAAS